MTSASIERLHEHVCRIEGERHPERSPEALKAAARYIHGSFEASGLKAGADSFAFRGASYDNIVAVKEGEDPSAPRVLIGAHYDSVRGTPGADLARPNDPTYLMQVTANKLMLVEGASLKRTRARFGRAAASQPILPVRRS